MTETPEKKKMSKGCMIGLIVGGVLIIMIAVALLTCYVKREALAKFGVTTVVDIAKQSLEKEPVPGLDTVAFNATVDEFIMKLESTEFNDDRLGALAQTVQGIQSITKDKRVDSSEVVLLLEAMRELFPNMERREIWDIVDVPDAESMESPE